MISDRRRVELTLPPHLCLHVVLNGADDQADVSTQTCIRHFRDAAAEAVVGLPRKQAEKLLRRSERAYHDVMAPYTEEGASVAKTGLIIFYVLQRLIESDYLVLGDQSSMARGLDILLPALEPAAQKPALDASAQKQAVKLLRRLQSLGYFQGVPADAV